MKTDHIITKMGKFLSFFGDKIIFHLENTSEREIVIVNAPQIYANQEIRHLRNLLQLNVFESSLRTQSELKSEI